MEISIIMSEYKTEEKILEESIKSILNQTYKEFEFIIVNDGKSNKLNKIVKKFDDPRIVVLENEQNLGLAKSLNRAIDYSSGNYLVRMDSDDIAHPERIEKQLSFIKKNNQYSVVGTAYNLLTETGALIPKMIEGEITAERLMNRIAPVHPSVIYKKKDILEVGKYEIENVNRCEDFVLWAQLLLKGKRIYIMKDILLNYRVNISDYEKRTFKTRKDEILNRFKYYRKLGANTRQYVSISKSLIAGILPGKVMATFHRTPRIK